MTTFYAHTQPAMRTRRTPTAALNKPTTRRSRMCPLCKVFIPAGQQNLGMHLSGRRHLQALAMTQPVHSSETAARLQQRNNAARTQLARMQLPTLKAAVVSPDSPPAAAKPRRNVCPPASLHRRNVCPPWESRAAAVEKRLSKPVKKMIPPHRTIFEFKGRLAPLSPGEPLVSRSATPVSTPLQRGRAAFPSTPSSPTPLATPRDVLAELLDATPALPAEKPGTSPRPGAELEAQSRAARKAASWEFLEILGDAHSTYSDNDSTFCTEEETLTESEEVSLEKDIDLDHLWGELDRLKLPSSQFTRPTTLTASPSSRPRSFQSRNIAPAMISSIADHVRQAGYRWTPYPSKALRAL